MERNRISMVWVYIFIMLVTDVYFCESFTLNVPSKTAAIGDAELILECDFFAESKEEVTHVVWSRKRDNEDSFTNIVAYEPGIPAGFYEHVEGLRKRALLYGSDASLDIVFNEVICSDAAVYKCMVVYVTNTGRPRELNISETMSLSVEATPLHLTSISRNPEKRRYGPNEIVDITCRGVVGHPPQVISWVMYRNGVESDVTSIAEQKRSYPDGPHSCSMVEESTLRMTAKNILVQCKLSQPDEPHKFDKNCDDLCRTTEIVGLLSPQNAKVQDTGGGVGNVAVGLIVCIVGCLFIVGVMLGVYVVKKHRNNTDGSDLSESNFKYGEFVEQKYNESSFTNKTLSFLKSPEPAPIEKKSDPVELIPDPIEQTPDPIEQTPDPIEQTPDPIDLLLDPLELTLDPIDLTPDPIEQTPDPIDLTPDPIEVMPDPIELTPDPIELTPDPVEITPDPVEITPDPVERTPTSSPRTPPREANFENTQDRLGQVWAGKI